MIYISQIQLATAAGEPCKEEGTLRLADANKDASFGRLEACIDGTWGCVCEYGFTSKEAFVACRQLGWDRVVVIDDDPLRAHPAVGEDPPFALKGLNCSGRETALVACRSKWKKPIPAGRCNHERRDVWLQCGASTCEANASDPLPARLVDAGRYFGRLQVCIDGTWGCVGGDTFTDSEADVACRQLGYDSSQDVVKVSTSLEDLTFHASITNESTLVDGITCQGNETSLAKCAVRRGAWRVNGTHREDVFVACRRAPECSTPGAWRLVDMDGRQTSDRWGRLQRCVDGKWVCWCASPDTVTRATADVICKELGWGPAGGPIAAGGDIKVVIYHKEYDEGWASFRFTHPPQCKGGEVNVDTCPLSKSPEDEDPKNDCSHDRDIYLECTAKKYPSPLLAVRGLGLVGFLQLAEVSGMAAELASPNLTATIFAPSNEAFEALLLRLGDRVNATLGNATVSRRLLENHIVRGVALSAPALARMVGSNATRLMTEGGEVVRVSKGPPPAAGAAAAAKAKAAGRRRLRQGALPIAAGQDDLYIDGFRVVGADQPGGKSYLHVIDGIMAPDDLRQLLGLPPAGNNQSGDGAPGAATRALSTSEASSSHRTGIIVGAVVGGVGAAAALIAAVALLVYRRRHHPHAAQMQMPTDLSTRPTKRRSLSPRRSLSRASSRTDTRKPDSRAPSREPSKHGGDACEPGLCVVCGLEERDAVVWAHMDGCEHSLCGDCAVRWVRARMQHGGCGAFPLFCPSDSWCPGILSSSLTGLGARIVRPGQLSAEQPLSDAELHHYQQLCDRPPALGHSHAGWLMEAGYKPCPWCGAPTVHYRDHGGHAVDGCAVCRRCWCFGCGRPSRDRHCWVQPCKCPPSCGPQCGCAECPACEAGRPCAGRLKAASVISGGV